MVEQSGEKRRRLGVWVAGVCLLGACVGVGSVVFVQSAVGFQKVVIPLADRLAGIQITASWGRIGLDGSVVARDVHVSAPAWGITGDSAEFDARVDVRTFLGGRTPHLRAVRLRDARVVWTGSEPADEPASERALRLPVTVDYLGWDGGGLLVDGGEATTASLHGLRLVLRDLRPGASATLRVAANARIAPDQPRASTEGALRLSLDAPVAADDAFTWDGRGSAALRALDSDAVIGDEVAFAFTSSGGVSQGPVVEVQVKLDATQGERALGQVEGSGAYTAGDAGGVTLDVALRGVGPGFLNPILALAAPVQLARGTVEGTVSARTEAGEVVFGVALDGEDMVLAPTDGGARTAPVKVSARQSGAMAWSRDTLRVEEARLIVDGARRRLVTATLAEPLHLSFGEAAGDAPPARIALEIDDVPLSDLRPWVALSGSDPLGALDKGSLTADWLAVIEGEGRDVRATGTWTLVGATTPAPDPLGPFTLRHDLELTVVDQRHVALQPKSFRVALAGRELLTLAPRVTYDVTSGALDAQSSITVSDGPEALRRLGLLSADLGLRDGRFSGTLAAVQRSADGSLALTLSLDGGPVRLVASSGRTVGRHGMKIALRASLDGAGAELTLDESTVTVVDQGAKPGVLTLSGHWPWSSQASRDGRIAVAVRDLDARTWGEWLGYVAADAVPTLPLHGDLVLERARGASSTRIRGTERLGPLAPALDDKRRAAPVTLKVEHDGHYTGKGMDGLLIELAADQGASKATASLEGTVSFAARTYVKLDGTATGLDLSPWAALYMGPERPAPTTARSPSTFDLGQYFDFAIPIDLDVALDLTRCAYFDLPIEQGRLTLNGRGGNLTARLDAPKAGGGSVTLVADLIGSGRTAGVTWTVDAKNMDVGKLYSAMRWGKPSPFTARGSFATSGRGRGVGKAIGRTLDGHFAFDLTQGEFGDTEILDYIARQTGVWAFQRMGFDQLAGRVQLANGEIRLEHALVQNVESKLAAGGVLYDGARQEWRINPRVDEKTWRSIAGRFQVPGVLIDDGYMSLPIDIIVTGTWDNPRYAVGPRSGLIEAGASSLLERVDEATGLGIGGALGGALGLPAPSPAPPSQPAPAPSPRPRTGAPEPVPTAAPTKPTVTRPTPSSGK